jgi:hypothetical protein
MVTGGVGFAVVSLCVFATVAFGETWMYRHLTALGAYLAWTVLFILLGGGVLGSLVIGKWRLPKFYLLFAAAFFMYAVGWVASYSMFSGRVGEWLGSVTGSILMAAVIALGFGTLRSVLSHSVVLFAANSIGYFTGSALNNSVGGRTGMLLWGLTYGLCLGTGIGAVLCLAQTPSAKS